MTLSTRSELRAPIIAALHRLLGTAVEGGASDLLLPPPLEASLRTLGALHDVSLVYQRIASC